MLITIIAKQFFSQVLLGSLQRHSAPRGVVWRVEYVQSNDRVLYVIHRDDRVLLRMTATEEPLQFLFYLQFNPNHTWEPSNMLHQIINGLQRWKDIAMAESIPHQHLLTLTYPGQPATPHSPLLKPDHRGYIAQDIGMLCRVLIFAGIAPGDVTHA